MLSYRDLLNTATKTLYEISDTPRIDAEYLMQHAISQSMAWLISHGDTEASAAHKTDFLRMVAQRASGVPVAYILGYRDFWTLRLKVNENVLIPRGDTEVLVEQALERIDTSKDHRLADLGTGSGAIALSLAKERPNCNVLAVDKYSAALNVARENADLNGVNNVEFIESNWFDSIAGDGFSLIASNPPYIKPKDPHLAKGDLRFEPDSALVSPDHGLRDLTSLIDGAPNFLIPEGWLLLEHGFEQADDVETLLDTRGFTNISLYSDLNHLPRCTAAQWIK